MKKSLLFVWLFSLLVGHSAFAKMTNEPDSAYLFAYSTKKSAGHSGLLFAWSADRKNWHSIGQDFRFLFCDYGKWGSQKRMVNPFLFQGADQMWHCIWSVNENDGVFAHAESKDLMYWYPQTYPDVAGKKNCLQPEVSYDAKSKIYTVTWMSDKCAGTGGQGVFGVTTKDFKTYSATKSLPESARLNIYQNIVIGNDQESGIVRKVSWSTIDALIKKEQLSTYKKQLYSENLNDDSTRYKGLKTLDATVKVNMADNKKISDKLIGVFFEDINYAADGGLYAEMVQNRDFEYALSDKEGYDKSWNSYKAWSLKGDKAEFVIDSISPIHENNKHYALLKIKQAGAGLVNEGFDGIAVKSGEKYDFSVFARNIDGKNRKLVIRLTGDKGEVYAETSVTSKSADWKKYSSVMVAKKTVTNAKLEVIPQEAGNIALDMISLFPQKTYKGHKNGLRADLAQTIADIHPRFVRFPGGCVAHGDGLGNIYRWKNTIGPLEVRKPMRNLWGYHQSMGLGYYEYFRFCEDMGAEPLPVIAAGVPCQNSGVGGAGQQGGVPMCDMDQYVQDVLDLIEWANGDVKSKWGKLRAQAGHPKPFNLKYVGIGNEDLITDIFEERFTKIFKAVKEKYPEITVIGTVGPFYEGTDYTEGWKIATKLGVPMVDEHYYESPGWFINNQDFYDKYDRSKPKVYLGEYASWGNSMTNALAEALYLTGVERNADVVSMSSYAPMLAKEGHTQWSPDMIYFNNSEVKPTINYYVQKLYGQNSGDTYFESSVDLSDNKSEVKKRVGVSVVRDSKTNDMIVKLANLLPVSIKTQVKLDGAENVLPNAVKTVLAGKPEDKSANPVESTITVSKDFPCELPAYSFTVIRIKTK